MGNIKNYNFNSLKFQLSDSQYWDFFLIGDDFSSSDDIITSGDCFVVWYDFNNENIFPNNEYSATTINSLVYWTGATNTGYTFNTIGLTGIDNGLISFDKLSADTSNQALLSALTGSTLVIASGDSKLHLTRVTGTTGDYVYPMTKLSAETVGSYMNLCGGFIKVFIKLMVILMKFCRIVFIMHGLRSFG